MYSYVSSPQNGPKFTSLHTPWLQLTFTPAKENHTHLSETQHPQSYSKENIAPCRGFPANRESEDIWQLLCPTHSQATLGQIPPTAEEAVRELGAVVASLRPSPLPCSEDRSHHHSLKWNEAVLRSCLRAYPTAGSFFFTQLRTRLWWYMGNFTPTWAARDVDGFAQPLFLPLSLNGYPTLKMFPMLENKFLHRFIGLEFMAHRKKKKEKEKQNKPPSLEIKSSIFTTTGGLRGVVWILQIKQH